MKHTREDALRIIGEKSVRDPVTGCRVWTGAVTAKRGKLVGGYGYTKVDGKDMKVHRIVFEDEYGPQPQSVHVLHKCDNRLCTEITHLFDGNNRVNIDDKIQKDRSGKKLNIDRAKKVKEMLAQGFTQSYIAQAMGVRQPMISRINTGKRWTHLNRIEVT